MTKLAIASVAGALMIFGASSASAQVIVQQTYAAPFYTAPAYTYAAPVYSARVVIAPARRVYVAPAPVPRRVIREVFITDPAPGWVGPYYPGW
jgi:hypothetical protein